MYRKRVDKNFVCMNYFNTVTTIRAKLVAKTANTKLNRKKILYRRRTKKK